MPLYRAGGHTLGTPTNDAAAAGEIGEYGYVAGENTSQTFTITLAAPGVATAVAHGYQTGTPLNLTTNGALPTGLSTATNYYAIVVDANTFKLATTVANAIAGTGITTSVSQSGTHTAIASIICANATVKDVTGLALAAGDYELYVDFIVVPAATTTVINLIGSISTTSGTADVTSGSFVKRSYSAAGTAIGGIDVLSTGPLRVSIAVTTNYFAVLTTNFGTSTMTAYARMRWRRVR
jgi:hypothetical protein